MTVTMVELHDSRSANVSAKDVSAKIIYMLEGSADDADIHEHILTHAPSNHLGLFGDSYTLKPIKIDGVNSVWRAELTYKLPDEEKEQQRQQDQADRNAERTWEISFSTTGASMNISHSIETVNYNSHPNNADPAPIFDQAIMVGSDGSISGTDIVIPTLTFTEVHSFAPSLITYNFIKTLSNLTGTTNNAAFRTFQAGEVLFTGAEGSWNDNLINITYNFAMSPNLTSVDAAGVTGLSKKGHELIWVYYQDEVDASAHAATKSARAAYVEKVYEGSDFDDLHPSPNVGLDNAITSRAAYASWRATQRTNSTFDGLSSGGNTYTPSGGGGDSGDGGGDP
jgi:hypothetical protein